MRILFFIESLCSGGKERRLVELLFYIKHNTNFQISLVLTEDAIHYSYVTDLDIPIHVIKRKYIKYDPSLFFRFFKIVKEFNPDIIHTWGIMTTMYTIPTKLILKKVFITNLIANVDEGFRSVFLQDLLFRTCVHFSDIVLSNSMAGIRAYHLQNNPKIKLIYNGVRLERFSKQLRKEKIKEELNIKTASVVLMVASASIKKDYDLFLDVAKLLGKTRTDISFIGVGKGSELQRLRQRVVNEKIDHVHLLGMRNDVESLISIADICTLFTFSEGISNSIIEYMALGKPVITTDTRGGSKEIIEDGVSGYIVDDNIENIVSKITKLLDNPALMNDFGRRGREIISQKFSIERMGQEYEELYRKFDIKR